MSSKTFVDFTRYAMLPLLLIVLGAARLFLGDTPYGRAFPFYREFFGYFALITIERVYFDSRTVSQRDMIGRELMSTAVQTFVAGAVMGAIVLPVLHYFPDTFLGRRVIFG